MKHKALFGLLFLAGLEFLSFLVYEAPSVQGQNCAGVPSFVTTAPPQPGMLTVGSTWAGVVYDASQNMQPINVTFEICGYWRSATQDLYYVTASQFPNSFWWFNRESVPNG